MLRVPSSSAGVAAVIGTFVGISRRHAGGENGCDSQELGVTIDSFGVDNEQYGVGEGNSVEGLVFSTGVPSKVTMVMMTFSALPRRKTRSLLSTREFLLMLGRRVLEKLFIIHIYNLYLFSIIMTVTGKMAATVKGDVHFYFPSPHPSELFKISPGYPVEYIEQDCNIIHHSYT